MNSRVNNKLILLFLLLFFLGTWSCFHGETVVYVPLPLPVFDEAEISEDLQIADPALALGTPCQAGDRNTDSDEFRDYFVSCDSTNTDFYSMIISYSDDGLTEQSKTDYDVASTGNNRSMAVAYYPDGITKQRMFTYDVTTTNPKTSSSYSEDGTKLTDSEYDSAGMRSVSRSYASDGETKKLQTMYYASNGNRKNVVSYLADGETADTESNFYEESGNREFFIDYEADGMAKNIEITFYDNSDGRYRSSIDYQSDGVTPETGSPLCYADTSNNEAETCDMAKHGCITSSTTCIQ